MEQTARRCSVTPTARQLRAAQLMIIDGLSAKAALTAVGYSPKTARCVGQLIRGSKGLRAALRIVRESVLTDFRPAPQRRRYARRPTVKNFNKYVYLGAESETTNAAPQHFYEQERRSRAVDAGLEPPPPARAERMAECSLCMRPTRQSKMFIGPDGSSLICERCATQ